MDEQKVIKRMSVVGIFGNILLAAFKLLAGIFKGSLLHKVFALISDNGNSKSVGTDLDKRNLYYVVKRYLSLRGFRRSACL